MLGGVHSPYPTVGRPRCFMRFLTSSESSCRSERRYRLSLCCEIRSALLAGLLFFLLSRRAHCMLFFLRSGCSDWSLVVEFLWAVFSFQDARWSRCSSPRSALMDAWDCRRIVEKTKINLSDFESSDFLLVRILGASNPILTCFKWQIISLLNSDLTWELLSFFWNRKPANKEKRNKNGLLKAN